MIDQISPEERAFLKEFRKTTKSNSPHSHFSIYYGNLIMIAGVILLISSDFYAFRHLNE